MELARDHVLVADHEVSRIIGRMRDVSAEVAAIRCRVGSWGRASDRSEGGATAAASGGMQ